MLHKIADPNYHENLLQSMGESNFGTYKICYFKINTIQDGSYGSRYSRMDQEKFVEDNL